MASTATPRAAKRRLALVATAACVVLAFLAYSTSAKAETYMWSGKLAGSAWTLGPHLGSLYGEIAEQQTNNDNICVGPVVYSGSTATFPYGWHCKQVLVIWEFTPITAYAGIYNQGGKAFTYNLWGLYS